MFKFPSRKFVCLFVYLSVCFHRKMSYLVITVPFKMFISVCEQMLGFSVQLGQV